MKTNETNRDALEVTMNLACMLALFSLALCIFAMSPGLYILLAVAIGAIACGTLCIVTLVNVFKSGSLLDFVIADMVVRSVFGLLGALLSAND